MTSCFRSGGFFPNQNYFPPDDITDLNSNKITANGVAALASAAGDLPALVELSLFNNRGISDAGARSVARALRDGGFNALEYLVMLSTGMTGDGKRELRHAWRDAGKENPDGPKDGTRADGSFSVFKHRRIGVTVRSQTLFNRIGLSL